MKLEILDSKEDGNQIYIQVKNLDYPEYVFSIDINSVDFEDDEHLNVDYDCFITDEDNNIIDDIPGADTKSCIEQMIQKIVVKAIEDSVKTK